MEAKNTWVVLAITCAMFFVWGAIVTMLWNMIIPYILYLPMINYWQGVGLAILSTILFKKQM